MKVKNLGYNTLINKYKTGSSVRYVPVNRGDFKYPNWRIYDKVKNEHLKLSFNNREIAHAKCKEMNHQFKKTGK